MEIFPTILMPGEQRRVLEGGVWTPRDGFIPQLGPPGETVVQFPIGRPGSFFFTLR